MSTTPVPNPAPVVVKTSIFATILKDLQIATQIIALVPSPISPFAGVALELESVVGAAIGALAASKGMTVAEVIATLPDLSQPLP